MNQNLKRGMIIILISNIINLVFKVFINFMQPKLLSVNTYAMIQTYTLYMTYAAILHFGYIDGMYLYYGGKDLAKTNKKKLNNNVSTLRSMQLIITIICIAITLFTKNSIILFMSLSLIPVNLAAYFRMLFQAVGQFNKYGRIMNIHSALLFLMNFYLLLIVKSDNYVAYIWANILSYTIVWLILEKYYRQFVGSVSNKLFTFHISELKFNISEGLPLTLGNLASTLFYSLDRWFVKIQLKISDFACYSFAISIITFLNIAITPLTITLYNYFCSHNQEEEIDFIKNIVIIFSTFIVSSVFFAKIFINLFIPDYSAVTNILFILFATKIFDIVIQGIFVNQYKAQKKQRLYLFRLILCLIISFSINGFCFLVYNNMEAYALGTFLSMIIWYLICSHDLKSIHMTVADFFSLTISAIILIFVGVFIPPVMGFVIYLITIFLLDILLYTKEMAYFLKNVILLIHRIGDKNASS